MTAPLLNSIAEGKMKRRIESEYTALVVEWGEGSGDGIWLRMEWTNGPHAEEGVLYELTHKESIILARALLEAAVRPEVSRD